MKKRQRIRKSSRNGATTVEFAVVAPVIFLMFLGCLEMSNLNFVPNMANDAAFQVARRAIIPGADVDAAISDSKDVMGVAGIKQVKIATSETTDEFSVTVSVPMDANTWGLSRFVSGKSVVHKCVLSKQVKSAVGS